MPEDPTQNTVERPERGELDPAALALLERHGTQIMLAARRHAATLEDAEDAFQRAFEIMLAKAPTTREKDLVPWLKTVVKHEAFALRQHQERHAPVTVDGELLDRPAPIGSTHDQVERRERMAHAAEALARLKPREVRAMVLRAEGYSYREICEQTGWTHTMVNRALTEGRRAFRTRLAGIEAGIECTRLEPLLSRLADREADAEDLAQLRPHMKTCLTCRKRLKEFRAAPGHVAALAPAGAAVAQSDSGGALRGFAESVVGALQHKVAALGERAHAAAEVITGQKVAAVAASAAALAGGGTAVDRIAAAQDPPPVPAAQVERAAAPVDPETTAQTTSSPALTSPSNPGAQAQAAEPQPAPPPEPRPANEFDPAAATAAQSTAAVAQPRQQPAQSTTGTGIPSSDGSGRGTSAGSGGGGEFTP